MFEVWDGDMSAMVTISQVVYYEEVMDVRSVHRVLDERHNQGAVYVNCALGYNSMVS